MKMKIDIEKLAHPIYCGDWHDKPLRWCCVSADERQNFSTKKEAKLYRVIRRRSGSEGEAIRAYAATA